MNPQVHTSRGLPVFRTPRPALLTAPNQAAQCIDRLRLFWKSPQCRQQTGFVASLMIIIWLGTMNAAMAQTCGQFTLTTNQFAGASIVSARTSSGFVSVAGVPIGSGANNTGNVVDGTLTNTAQLGVLLSGSAEISTQVSSTTFAAGATAGYVVESGLLNLGVGQSIQITTYLNGTQQDQQTVGTLLDLPILGSGTTFVGIPTTKPFNEIQVRMSVLLGAALSLDVYYPLAIYQGTYTAQNSTTAAPSSGSISVALDPPAVIASQAPLTYTWSPNVSSTSVATGLTTGTYSVTISRAGVGCLYSKTLDLAPLPCGITPLTTNNVTGVTAASLTTGVCVGCSVSSLANVTDANTTNFATINVLLGVAGGAGIDLASPRRVFPAGVQTGVVLVDDGALSIGLFQATNIVTYFDGSQQETASVGNFLDLPLLTTGYRSIGFTTTKPFDEVRVVVGSLASALVSVKAAYLFVLNSGFPISGTVTNATIGLTNGAISATATGGTPPYAYQWSNNATTSSISGLSAGTYSLTVSDATNCIAAKSFTVGSSLPGVPSLTVVAPITPGPLSQVVSGTTSLATAVVITNSNGLTVCASVAVLSGSTFSCSLSLTAGVNSFSVISIGPGGITTTPITLTGVALPTVAITTPLLNGTATTTPTITGLATPNAVVTLTGGVGGPVSVTADVTGLFSTSALTFAPGVNSLTAVAVNLGGISIPALTSFTVLGVPSLTVAAPLTAGPLSQVVSGTTVGATAVIITDASGLTVCASVAILSSTTFSCPLSLTAGVNSFSVISIGPGGITTTPITLTGVALPTVAITTPLLNGTATTTPTITGLATPNAVVTLTGGVGGPVSVTADVTGLFSTSALTFAPGVNSLTALAVNLGGISIPALTSFTVLGVPSLSVAAALTVGPLTQTVSGTTVGATAVIITNANGLTLCASVAILSSTTFSCPLSLTAGQTTVTVTAIGPGGVTTVTVTLTAVGPPSLTVVAPPVSGTTTVISGSATPGSGIVITNPIGTTLCSTVATSGTFACSVTVPLGPVSLTVTATGPGGSTSVPVSLSVIGVPTVAILSPANGLTVATTTTSVSGTAMANSTVVLTGPVGTTLGTVVATASGTFSITGLTFAAGTYSLTATATNEAGAGIPAVSSFTVASPVVGTTVLLPIRVYLQGGLTSTTVTATMRDDLRSKGLVPLVEPYTSLSYTHAGGGGGETTTPAVLAVTGANAIVDWVVAELRSAANPAQIVATRSGLLQRDGDLVDVDGVTSLTFGIGASAGTSYFVSVHHRNHLGVMTATALPLSTTNTVVDFTSTSTAVYQFPVGNALRSSAPLASEGGLPALWAGNTTGDTRVILQGPDNDVDPVFFSIVGDLTNTQTFTNFIQSNVYSTNDVNLDGQVIFQGPDNEVDLIFFEILSHPDNTGQFVNFIIRQQIP